MKNKKGEIKGKSTFVASHAKQGDRIIIIVPKEYKRIIEKLTQPMLITVKEIL